MRGFLARIRFNGRRRYDDIRTWFAVEEFDEFTQSPTGWVLKIGAQTGEQYRVRKEFHDSQQRQRKAQRYVPPRPRPEGEHGAA